MPFIARHDPKAALVQSEAGISGGRCSHGIVGLGSNRNGTPFNAMSMLSRDDDEDLLPFLDTFCSEHSSFSFKDLVNESLSAWSIKDAPVRLLDDVFSLARAYKVFYQAVHTQPKRGLVMNGGRLTCQVCKSFTLSIFS
jgi:hypothetical protein